MIIIAKGCVKMTDIQTKVIGRKTYYKVIDISKKLGMSLNYAIQKIGAEVVKVSDPKCGSVRFIDDDNIDKLILFMSSDNYNKPTEADLLTKIMDAIHKGETYNPFIETKNTSNVVADNPASDFLKFFLNQQFGCVRVLIDNDNLFFCGVDIATALGYKNTKDALLRHCREDGVVFYDLTDNIGREQKTKFITEGNVYRLIAYSKLPTAEQFEKWLFEEVLPSIRKHGTYMTPDTLDKMIESPEFGIKLLTALKDEREKNKQMKEENERLQLVNQGLIHQTMTWNHRPILNSLMRSLAHTSFHNDFRYAYNTLYKELRYKKGISLSNRPGEGKLLDKIRDDEWNDVIEVAIALCKQSGVDVGNVINEVNAERVIK